MPSSPFLVVGAESVGRRRSMLRYLEMVREKNCPELGAGFAAILTDYVSTVLGGCVPDPECYKDLIDDNGAQAE
jgi:hypothetical protein